MAKAAAVLIDLTIVGGVASIATGFWLIMPALGLIVGGALVAALALALAQRV